MITTVLLDAGGVILDESQHEEVRFKIATGILADVSPGYSENDLRRDLDEAIAVFCPRVLAYAVWKQVKPDCGLFDRLMEAFRNEWAARRPPLKIMPGFEREIAGISDRFQVGVAGQYGGDLLDLLERENLLNHFTHRFTQDDFDITKPDPRYLERIAVACGTKPSECIMVGDRIDNDVIPAKQVGMKVVLVRGGLHRRQIPRTPYEIPDGDIIGIKGLAEAVALVAAPSARQM
jgi:putative hydrolase of the HAD superfamily